MNNWTNWQVPIYEFSDKKRKLRDVPFGTIVFVVEESETMRHVQYTDTTGKLIDGWVDKGNLETYERALPYDCVLIEDATPDENDAKQYIFWKNSIKQVNMCGELCVAYVTGHSLREVLTDWEVKLPSLWKRVFGYGKATGTGNYDLISLLALMNRFAYPLNMKKYTPGALADLVKNNDVIVGVRINHGGELRSGSILHWVTVTEVVQDRKLMGWVRVYNPYMNCIEQYSWDEFVRAAGAPYGVVAPKESGNVG